MKLVGRWFSLMMLLLVFCMNSRLEAKKFEIQAEIMVGQMVAGDLENQFGISDNPEFNAEIQNIALQLAPLAQREGIDYQFRVLNTDEVNAYAVMGGNIYINKGLLKALGFASSEFNPLQILQQMFGGGGSLLEPIPPAKDELAFIMSHEITHIKQKHGVKQVLLSMGLSLLLGDVDSKKAGGAAKLLVAQLLTSGRSRDDEKEADKKGVELMVEAGYDPAAALAVMRRIETLSSNQKELGIEGLLSRQLATHPPNSDRCEVLKDNLIKSLTGLTFKADIAYAATQYLNDSYKYDDPAWPAKFEEKTKRRISNLELANSSYRKMGEEYLGQCTWFVVAVREDNILPIIKGKVNAWVWYDAFKNAGYGCGPEPKIGSIAVWDKKIAGTGHVALVTGVNGDGTFEVWDSNWSASLDRKVRNRVVYSKNNITGFVYWPNGKTEPDKILISPDPQIPNQPRNIIDIQNEQFHLGDNQADSKTIWLKEFALSAADLANRTKAKLSLKVKGTPKKDPIIYINRQKIGYAITQTDEWEDFSFPFDPKILQAGNNLIDIETIIANLWQTFDECEIQNIQLIFE